MADVVSGSEAFAMIEAGDVPTVMQGDADLRRLLREAGYFDNRNERGAWRCVRPFCYRVVNVGAWHTQVDLVEWFVGQVVPKMTVVDIVKKEKSE